MHQLVINGPCQLKGETWVSGSKNSALPILAATLLCEKGTIVHGIPHLKDVTSMISLLSTLGMVYSVDDKLALTVEKSNVTLMSPPSDLVKSMRASILILGPMVSRFGEVTIDMPGGCAIGARPINLHLDMMSKMGASVVMMDDKVHVSAPKLTGATIDFEKQTVTGTENAIMAAVCAEGRTVLNNVAKEPEVSDLCDFLRKCGAKIIGDGTESITIDGVDCLGSCEHRIVPDRIEAGTLLIAAAMTKGAIKVNDCEPMHLESVFKLLEQAGASLDIKDKAVSIDMPGDLKPVSITTEVYPGVPTDLQAQFMAMNAVANGQSSIEETIFENRFKHVGELKRMGADISLHGNKATIVGVEKLKGCVVKATDLRASAALILAALCAQGESVLESIHHIDRGYSNIEEKLSALGACIRRHPNYMVL
ncbi:MAG: UDP-N-acetylglucosamine 1-carboxyvinyltransferase [Gammaproteobacteria bacterium]|nr:UDP-N-acetylglucosamine 1-carboxyvinyltransferase [Gammaproteobacteria bacterium]